MKIATKLRAACFTLLILGGASARWATSAVEEGPPSPSVAPVPASSGFKIEVSGAAAQLRDRSRVEQLDQLRDWALVGTLSHLRYPEDAIARATHQMPPVRLPYLEELFAFDYGRGRRAILGDDEVVALLDADDPDPTATLGRLGDKVRMEIGHPPGRVRVFVATPDLEHGFIAVAERGTVPGERLFSEEFGYARAQVTDAASLERWLGSVDDVTFVAVRNGQVELGGRRGRCDRTASVTLEDVAALHQAHAGLAAQKARLDEIKEAFGKELYAARRRTGLVRLEGGLAAPPTPAEKLLYRTRLRAAGLVDVAREPGFSLDPQYDEKALRTTLERFVRSPCSLLADVPALRKRYPRGTPDDAAPLMNRLLDEIEEGRRLLDRGCRAMQDSRTRHAQSFDAVKAALATSEDPSEWVAPLYGLAARRSDAESRDAFLGDATLRTMARLAIERDRLQCARYDGPIQGTRVGMNLFYTDLLAKLWESVDYHRSAPVLAIGGFISSPRRGVDPAWVHETREKPSTRLWFGPKREAFTRTESEGGTALHFDRIATRVFAAGSNPEHPGDPEANAEEGSRLSFGWWDRHYANVADHEQQYHLQNEIMKWSVITGLLHSSGAGAFLQDIAVRRDWTFDRWLKEMRPRLRYQHPVLLRPRSEWRNGRECLDILSSYRFSGTWTVSGGVSLGGNRAASEALVLRESAPAALRRSIGGAEGGKLDRAWPLWVSEGRVQVAAQQSTRTRMGAAELKLPEITAEHGRTPFGRRVAMTAGEQKVGALDVGTRGSVTELRWTPGEFESARALVAPRARAATHGTVSLLDEMTLIVAGEEGRHLELTVSAALDGAEKAIATVRSPAGTLRMSPLSEAEFVSRVSRYEWQALARPADVQPDIPEAVARAFSHAAPDGREIVVEGIAGFEGGLKVRVAVNGTLWVARPQLGAESWANLDRVARLTGRDLERIAAAAAEQRGRIPRAELSSSRADELARALEGRNTSAAATTLNADGPRELLEQAQGILRQRADAALASGEGARASELYRIYEESRGADPELLLRKAIADVQSGLPARAVGVLEQSAGKLDALTRSALNGSGHGEVVAVLDARAGVPTGVGESAARAVTLEADGGRVVTARTGKLERSAVANPAREVEACRRRGCAVYVDDTITYSRVDFEVNPDGNLTELLRDPEVAWERVVLQHAYDPGLLVDPTASVRLHRVVRFEAKPAPGAQRTALAVRRIAGTRRDAAAPGPIPRPPACELPL